MLSRVLNFFRDEEDNDPPFIKMTRNILIFLLILNAALLPLVSGFLTEEKPRPVTIIVLVSTLVLVLISLFLAVRGRVGMAKAIVPLSIVTAVAIISITINGLRDISIVALPLVIIVSALLMGKRGIWISSPLVVIIALVISIIDLGSDRRITRVGMDDAVIIVILLFAYSAVIQILIARLSDTINKLRVNEKIKGEENRELNELRQSLEKRVEQRTAELDASNKSNLKRAGQFAAIAQVLKAVSTIQETDPLLLQITRVISDQFNTYHTGIFLLDGAREFAVLRASNSEGGRRMLARGHKLKVGQTGIVGFVTATGRARIALNVGVDAAYFDNPDLPETRSEIALPLIYAGQIIGALDLQSTAENAFDHDDLEVLLSLADQVSVTLNYAIILEEARRSLSESQTTFSNLTRETWKVLRPKSTGLGFQSSEARVTALESPLEGAYIQEALSENRTVVMNRENEPSALAIPIRLRGRIIGVISLTTRRNRRISSDETEITEAVAERLSLAIETAVLLQSTQHRADIERITTDISAKVSASTRLEAILQTAAQELSRALGGSDVLVQIEPTSIELGMAG